MNKRVLIARAMRARAKAKARRFLQARNEKTEGCR